MNKLHQENEIKQNLSSGFITSINVQTKTNMKEINLRTLVFQRFDSKLISHRKCTDHLNERNSNTF